MQQRLRARGDEPDSHPWEYRRAAECCVVHESDVFAVRVDAATETPDQLAARIAQAIVRSTKERAA